MMASQQPTSSSRRTRTGDKSVGSFAIEDEIGKGSFATVYRGVHKQSGALVAIKSVNLSKLNKKLKENLYSEIDILKGLEHPHIVALMDCRESTTHIHLVMEFCELGDLSFFIKKRDRLATNPATRDMAKKYPNPIAGGLNEVITRHFLKQLSSALQFLRERNFIHRDLKPQNLLLNPSAQYLESAPDAPLIMGASEKSLRPNAGVPSLPMLKVADFGFARSLPATSLAETLCGSPLYMAPEILRYEKYDAKADLWSVGTVLYEMMAGRPPFRASNHVELLRKIEQGEDQIRFPKESILSTDMKALIRALLKRNPVERLSFEKFFANEVITGPIPGLVGEDRPRPARQPSYSEESATAGRSATQHTAYDVDDTPVRNRPSSTFASSSPPTRQSRTTAVVPPRPSLNQYSQSTSPRTESVEHQTTDRAYYTASKGQYGQRPPILSAATAPNRQSLQQSPYTHTNASLNQRRASVEQGIPMARNPSRESGSPGSSLMRDPQAPQTRPSRTEDMSKKSERERAAQEVEFEREYVLIERQAVVVNAFADEMAASPELKNNRQHAVSPRSGSMVRRATIQGNPVSATGAVPAAASKAMQIAQGNNNNHNRQRPDVSSHNRQNSFERRYGPSPGATTSAISKAIQGASLRLFGIGYPPQLLGKGQSPPRAAGAPQLYSPFPAYPTPQYAATPSPPPQGVSGLIGEGRRPSGSVIDEDLRSVRTIEESAQRSDVVYGFAEVKYKQLIPLAPSMDHGLGGANALGLTGGGADTEGEGEDEGLTAEAVVQLSEEALVLYVKALSILAKSMDIAGAWWSKKNHSRGEVLGGGAPSSFPGTRQQHDSSSSSTTAAAAGARINVLVQWVRARFNDVLEKAEYVRLKLLTAQKQLPPEHPSHPSNHAGGNGSGSGSSRAGAGAADANGGVHLSAGVSAEKVLYDRALEMSRTAAINEIANEDLLGCEISYMTAISMLEAVLEDDDDGSGGVATPLQTMIRKGSLTGGAAATGTGAAARCERDGREESSAAVNGIDLDDRQAVQKVVVMVRNRLATLRKKMAIIAKHAPAQQQMYGGGYSRSSPHSGGTTPTITSTPPK